jgi:hypothetical protein
MTGSSDYSPPGGSGGSTPPGGSNGQIEYNNSGAFGGFTASGDATINTSTGAVTVTSTNGTPFGTAATENLSSVIVDNGSGALTIGSAEVTGSMIASSVALAGNPTTTTQTATTNNTTIATTAFVQSNILGFLVLQQGRAYGVSGNANEDTSSSGTATIYFGPTERGNVITIDNGSGVLISQTFSEASLSLSGLSGGYDIYANSASSSTVSITAVAWTNATTPPTRSTDAAGRFTKHSATNFLLVAAIYVNATPVTADWTGERWISNVYNQIPKALSAVDSTASWTYASTTLREARGQSTDGASRVSTFNWNGNQAINLTNFQLCSNGTLADGCGIAIGVNSSTGASVYVAQTNYTANALLALSCNYAATLSVGLNYFTRLEDTYQGGTATFFGSGDSGMSGIMSN